MNPDEYDFFGHLPKESAYVGLDLVRGLEDRNHSRPGRSARAREKLETFAEDKLVRKKRYDEMRCEMPGQPRSTFLMVFSPDGSRVASTHGNHNIYVTDIKSGKNVKTLVGHPRTPWCIAFHPTSNQIVASGCLGGEVRIWDLSGGSEVWTTGNQSVIASIAFHPNDRVLVIATYNELYFWDWSKPEPFVQIATSNPKEKIRYVAFDKLGHKLITGIANSPQTRWERVRAPVPVPRQVERSASPYRLRITPRLVNVPGELQERAGLSAAGNYNDDTAGTTESSREPVSNVPERERRITASYRNLLREYEQLVQRYLKIYRPPTMIDRGTDPMEPNATTSGTQTPEPSASDGNAARAETAGSSSTPSFEESSTDPEPQPSTSQNCSSSLMMPSRLLAMKKQPTLVHGTQTSESRKHKSSDGPSLEPSQGKRVKCDDDASSTLLTETSTQTQSPRKVLVINAAGAQPAETSSGVQDKPSSSRGVRILCLKKRKLSGSPGGESQAGCSRDEPGTSRAPEQGGGGGNDDFALNIRPIAEEVRNRFLPIIKSLPACDRPKLIRRFENSRVHERMKFRQMCPNFLKKPNRRPVILDTSSDSSSSDDDQQESAARVRLHSTLQNPTANQNSGGGGGSNQPAAASGFNTNIAGVRNFIVELEQLLMTVLLTEVEGGGGGGGESQNNLLMTVDSANPAPSTSRGEPSTSGAAAGARMSSPVYMSATRDDDIIRPSAVISSLEASSIFTRLMSRAERNLIMRRGSLPVANNSDLNAVAIDNPVVDVPGSPPPLVHTGTSRTSSPPIFSRTYPRRRLSSHRISAFMPTRVNYNRAPMRYRRGASFRMGSRFPGASSYALDELINYSERTNSEGEPQLPFPLPNVGAFDAPPEPVLSASDSGGPGGTSMGTVYSNIVQDLETSLNDVRNLRASSRPRETSDMLSSFSESLENIMNQSDAILRNLGGSMMMLPNHPADQAVGEGGWQQPPAPRASFGDPSFYVRDQRPQEAVAENDPSRNDTSVIESDHSYPRYTSNRASAGGPDGATPLVTSLHLTISYIQRQARLLRQQVESIERIDRAMFEVEQLQLIRRLILESLRYVRSSAGESRGTGMSSVRQMMAGTRISDSSPYDSQAEDTNQPIPQTSTPSTSSAAPADHAAQIRPRTSGRKTYPPSRLFRLQRHCRRTSFVNFFPRRYGGRPERGAKAQGRAAPPRTSQDSSYPLRLQMLSSYSLINSSSLNLMARRLEHLLTEQTRTLTRDGAAPSAGGRFSPPNELGERILSIRLQDCVLRMNRILGDELENDRFRSYRTDAVVVTQDGACRYSARHFLSLIVDGMSKHIEELGGANLSQSVRGQIYSVLGMALLLSDLLLLQLVDSIPPPAGMNLDVERESLTSRIDQMCSQMLQNRFSGHSHQLTRSLQHMRLTMRHAYRALGQTYTARRNAMLPNRQESNRRQFLSRYLRNLNRNSRRQGGGEANQPARDGPSTSSAGAVAATFSYATLRDLILRYSDHTGEDEEVATSNSNPENSREEAPPRAENLSSNNSDDNDDDSEWYLLNRSRTTNLYRTNNVNLAQPEPSTSRQPAGAAAANPARSWNVPSVQVNDVPISEQPSLFHQRILSHRHRLVERVSEVRGLPQMSVLRPRFLHPLYASVNPFDADLDDPQRETTYDCDMVTTVTPNHRIQVWDVSSGIIPVISNPLKNIIVSECKIHNDASVDIANDGTILVTLLPSGGYLNVTNRLGVYSLRWDTLGQCLYTTNFEQNAVSVALSPLSRHLVVGLASRRVSIVPSDKWTMARIFVIDQKDVPGDRLPVLRDLDRDRDSRATNYKSVNCIRWLPTSGQGLIYATNTGQLVIMT